MAIFHLSIKIVSRSSGKGAVAAAAYRAGAKLEEREPLVSVTGMNPEQTLKRLSRICTNRSEEKLTGGL